MTWEIFAHNCWGLLAATLGAIAFPSIIFMALESDGALDPQDTSMLMMHIVMMHFNVLIFASALLVAQGRMSQLYAYPARTSAIVAWRMLPAMLIVFLQTALSIAVLNAVFELGWPIWGPACFLAVAFAAVQAALWLTDKSLLWTIAALTFVAAVLGMWFRSRYGSAIGESTHYWYQLTPADVVTMLAITAAAYCIAIAGVARNRRGEAPLSLGVIDWLYRWFDSPPSRTKPWATAARAYYWTEFRRKGWLMPAFALSLLVAGVMGWLILSRDTDELLEGPLNTQVMLFALTMINGILLGNLNHHNGSSMGQFLATRPMTDSQIARITMRTVAWSVLLTWLVWLLALSILSMILLVAGADKWIELPQPLGWWIVPASLLGAWVIAGVLASIVMTGSTGVFKILIGLITACLVVPLFAKFALTPDAQQVFLRIVVAIASGATLVVTAWIFAAAHRRALIHAPMIWTAAGLWAAAFVLAILQWPAHLEPKWFAYLLAAAVLALAVAPLAAAPLAISWNRHR